MEFASDETAGDAKGERGVIGGTEVGTPQGDAGVGDTCDAGVKSPVFIEIIDGDGVFDGELHGSVGENGVVAHDADAFDMVDGERQDEFFVALDAEGEVIPLDKETRGGQVEDILDDFGHGYFQLLDEGGHIATGLLGR